MTLLEQTITEYLTECHKDWELVPASELQHTTIVNRANYRPHRIVINDHHMTVEHYDIHHDSWHEEPWTPNNILNKIEIAISNIHINYNPCYNR